MPLTAEQHQRRKKGLGASDVSAVFGTSPYKSWEDLFKEKALGIKRERDPKLDDLAHWGELLEPVIRGEYAQRVKGRSWKVQAPTGTLVDTLQHPEIEWALATPDGLVYEPSELNLAGWTLHHGLEIKNRSYSDKPRWNDNHVPAEVASQAHWGMFVTGLPRWDVAGLIGGNDLRIVTLLRDEDLLKAMQAAAEWFWQGVVAKEIQDPTWIEGELEFIQRRLVNDADLAAFNRAAFWRKKRGSNVA